MDTKVIEEKIDSLLDAVKNSREYEEYKKTGRTSGSGSGFEGKGFSIPQ